jgi:superfamily I DNA/RNA helicase
MADHDSPEPGNAPDGAPDADSFIDTVINSDNQLQLVVAGPGAGKTHLFQTVLTARPGENLAVTFINNLVRDLEVALAGLASVNTFHGYAKHLLHQFAVQGLTSSFTYLPQSAEFLNQDAGWLVGIEVPPQRIRQAFHLMEEEPPIVVNYLRAASYYDVVAHDDAVYRVVSHLDDHPGNIPVKNQIVVDEVQDFNLLEMRLISHLATTSRILAAGDDDQALYAFKHATPQYIRDLGINDYTLYELPYCFRCPHVIIHAVHDVISVAKSRNLLSGRIDKKYWSHSKKKADSDEHPKIRAVTCTVDKQTAPYPARYILREIGTISEAEIASSWDAGHPCVMVIGPKNFLNRVYAVLQPHYPNNIKWKDPDEPFDYLVEGYTILANQPHSRLGWRLVTIADEPEGLRETILSALNTGQDLDQLLDPGYVSKHSGFASIVRKMLKDEAVTDSELSALLEHLHLATEDLLISLGHTPKPLPPEPDKTLPKIVLTSFTGAKGLSADYVFVVGMIDGHFPQRPEEIADTDVCELIVALTRTRKQCYLITSRQYAGTWVKPSVFFDFIHKSRIEAVPIDKNSDLPT